MIVVAVEDGTAHKGPKLPADFPAPLLLRICNAILAPIINDYSPLKPYSRPWSRSTPAPWVRPRPSSSVADEPEDQQADWKTLGLSARGTPVTSCKSDLLAWVSCSKRMLETCGSMLFHHIRVTNLAIGDVLVSRRNYLNNTRVLEIYITREIESSQAQTDLNLARFFIQAGIILLWCPVVHTVILDIKAVPSDDYIWASFLSRIKQRLFIRADTASTPIIRTPPTMPVTAETNIVAGSGSEQSTTRNTNARWGDSQGLLHSHDRRSIPNLAIGMGYNAAGAVPDGFIGTLATMLSPHDLGTGGLKFLTSLNILIPRPAWGHEEAEGLALGLILRRLTGLKRLSVHADGVIQPNSGNNNEFGLMRKPPYSTTDTGDDEDSDDAADADMIVAEDGTVVYPSGSVSRATSSQSGQVSIVASSATNHVHVGYGPETWWAGLLNGLTVPHATSETTKKGPPESSYKQSIQELRISVFIPGGYVQLADFDAFFAMVVPYLQRLSTLETLIFDMVFDVQISTGGSSYYGYSRNGQRVLRDHFERQQAYVARLIDPHAPILPLVPLPDKPEMIHQRSEPYHTRPTSRMPRGITPTRAGTADSSFARIVPTSPGHIPVLTAGESSAETTRVGSPVQPTAAIPTRAIPLAKTLRHVYFGEYHGIPPLPPPDSIPVANGVMSYEHEHVGGSMEGGEGESTSPPLGDPGKSSSVSPGRTNAPKESGRKKKALLGGGVVGGVSPVGAAVGASITQGFGAGRTYLVRSGEREGSDEGASVDNNNQRSVPGMWWTVVREDSNAHEEPMQVDGPSMRSSSFSSAKESRRVIQGWEEVEDTSYVNSKLTDTMAIPGKGGVKEEEEITPPA